VARNLPAAARLRALLCVAADQNAVSAAAAAERCCWVVAPFWVVAPIYRLGDPQRLGDRRVEKPLEIVRDGPLAACTKTPFFSRLFLHLS
jgi:hypothetical protein